MPFRGQAGEGLEPVCIVSGAVFDGPIFHHGSYGIGDFGIERFGVIDGTEETTIDLFRETLPHHAPRKHIIAEDAVDTISGDTAAGAVPEPAGWSGYGHGEVTSYG